MNLLLFASLNEITTANHLIQGFLELGCEVKTIDAQGAIDVSSEIRKCSFEPDLILFIEGGDMRILPVNLGGAKCPTAWYGIDTHMVYEKHLRLSRLFDVTFVAQKEYVEHLRKDGIQQVHWLPLASEPSLFPRGSELRNVDIAYVGTTDPAVNPERHKLLERLKSEFSSTRFERATPVEMGKLYSQSKIVFNRSINNDINMRFFEAMGSGAVLVTNPITKNGIEDLFVEGEHYLSYSDEESLISLIKDLLSNEKKRREIGERAKKIVMGEHTYRHRAQKILKVVNDSYKLKAPGPEDYFSACLAMDIQSGALRWAGVSFENVKSGKWGRLLGKIISYFLNCFSDLIGLIEKAR